MDRIIDFLKSLSKPSDLSPSALKKFVKRSLRFFIQGDRLWHKQSTGRHQLIVFPSDRLRILTRFTMNLGTVAYLRRLDTWPTGSGGRLSHRMSDGSYVPATSARLEQLQSSSFPPTVATPAMLFQKCYMDTMFMEKHGGYIGLVQGRCSLTAWPEFMLLHTETGDAIGVFHIL